MTDTEVTNSAAGAPAGEFPDLGAKSPEKKREPKANFPKDDRRNGNGGRKGGGRDQRQDISDVTIDTPLVKPKHVPRPDEGMSNDKMVALREKIEEEEKRVVQTRPIRSAPLLQRTPTLFSDSGAISEVPGACRPREGTPSWIRTVHPGSLVVVHSSDPPVGESLSSGHIGTRVGHVGGENARARASPSRTVSARIPNSALHNVPQLPLRREIRTLALDRKPNPDRKPTPSLPPSAEHSQTPTPAQTSIRKAVEKTHANPRKGSCASFQLLCSYTAALRAVLAGCGAPHGCIAGAVSGLGRFRSGVFQALHADP